MGVAIMCFFCGKIFWKFLALGNLTCPLEPWWLCITQRMWTWTRDPGNQYCMTKQGSSYPQIVYWLPVSSVWSYPIGWAHIKINVRSHHATCSHRGAWAHVRLPRTKLKLMAMNWAQVTQKKWQQAQVYVSTVFLYLCLYFWRFNNYIEFLTQSLNRS